MIDYSVEEMLKNYKNLRAKTNLLMGNNLSEEKKKELNQLKNDLDNLDVCIAGLNEEDAELIKLYFFDCISANRITKKIPLAIATVYRRKNRAVAEIEANFKLFSKN